MRRIVYAPAAADFDRNQSIKLKGKDIPEVMNRISQFGRGLYLFPDVYVIDCKHCFYSESNDDQCASDGEWCGAEKMSVCDGVLYCSFFTNKTNSYEV